MKRRHVILAAAGLIIVFLLNAKFKFFGSLTFQLISVIAFAVLTYYYGVEDNTDDEKKNSIEPSEAIPVIQEYLEETPGKRKLFLHEDDDEFEKLHDRTLRVNINGKEKNLYGLVGRPVDPNNPREPEYSRSIGIIWNLTDNEFVASDMELPRILGADARIDPFYHIDDFVKDEGRRDAEQNHDSNVQQHIYTNPSEERSDRERGG